MFYELTKWFVLCNCVLASFRWCFCYQVEVTIPDIDHEQGKDSVSQFEIVYHDNPPFEIEQTNALYKSDFVHINHDRSARDEMREPDGIKVSGFLGNIRQKRALNQVTNECMKSENGSLLNKLVIAERGETIHLPCHSCAEYGANAFKSVKWVKLQQYPDSKLLYYIKEVSPDTHDDEKFNRVIVTLDHTLIIKRAKLSHTGNYLCIPSEKSARFINLKLDWAELQEFIAREAHMKYFFHVDVIDLNHADTIDVSSYAKRKPLNPEVLYHLNIEIGTRWYPWTPCSVCGEDGIRKRIGICFVRKHDPQAPISYNYLKNVFEFAADGLACQSEFLREFRNKKWLKRPNQIEMETCNVPCTPTNSTRRKREDSKVSVISKSEVKDENVKIADLDEEEKVKVKQKSVKFGSYFILKCPGLSISEAVNWVNGSELIHVMEIQKSSDKRITLDLLGNLHFKEAKYTDEGTYTCWLKKTLKQKYKVTIKEDMTKDMVKYTVYLSITFLFDFLVFMVLAIIKCLHRKVQKRIKRKPKKKTEDETGDNNEEQSDKDK